MRCTAKHLITIPAGANVKFASEEQAARTASLVTSDGAPAGWVKVLLPFQFKAGESFETDADFGKGYPGIEVEPEAAEAAPRKTLFSKAKAKA